MPGSPHQDRRQNPISCGQTDRGEATANDITVMGIGIVLLEAYFNRGAGSLPLLSHVGKGVGMKFLERAFRAKRREALRRLSKAVGKKL